MLIESSGNHTLHTQMHTSHSIMYMQLRNVELSLDVCLILPYCMNHMGPEKCLQMHLSTAAGASQERIAEGECQAVDDGFM